MLIFPKYYFWAHYDMDFYQKSSSEQICFFTFASNSNCSELILNFRDQVYALSQKPQEVLFHLRRQSWINILKTEPKPLLMYQIWINSVYSFLLNPRPLVLQRRGFRTQRLTEREKENVVEGSPTIGWKGIVDFLKVYKILRVSDMQLHCRNAGSI